VIPWLLSNYAWFAIPLIAYPFMVFQCKPSTPMDLKSLLFLWNIFQCLFSIVVFVKVFPSFWQIVSSEGMHETVCLETTKFSYVNNEYGIIISRYLYKKANY
jgi:hypothetical protein